MYIDKKSEIQRELEAEDNAMSTIYQAIIDHGGIIKWAKLVSTPKNVKLNNKNFKIFKSIEDIFILLNRIEMNFVKLEKYEKALYIKNEFDKLKEKY